MTDASRFGDSRFGGATFDGGGDQTLLEGGPDTPWRINRVRVDAMAADTDLVTVAPGQEVEYQARLEPIATDAFPDHTERLQTLVPYLERGQDVVTYDLPGMQAAYRDQHGRADGANLLRIAPLEPGYGATLSDGSLAPARDSLAPPRWAVCTGGEVAANHDDTFFTVTLTAMTLGRVSEHPSRATARDTFEENGV
jgi:hypothetical protein